jgi:GNAT superfamily N-acetyltransferase
MTFTIAVRQARLADVPIITGFSAAMAQETEGLALKVDRLRKGTDAILKDASKGIFYVAEIEGTIVGQSMVTYEWSDWRNATFWWIQSVYVRPDARHRGVFRALYCHIEALARARTDVCGLRLYVDQGNAQAQKAYAALGMKRSNYHIMEIDFLPH